MSTALCPTIDLAHDVLSLSEFRGKLTECVAKTRRNHRPILITQNGKSASVLISVDDFERLREAVELIDDVRSAETEIDRGETFSPSEVESYLKSEGLL